MPKTFINLDADFLRQFASDFEISNGEPNLDVVRRLLAIADNIDRLDNRALAALQRQVREVERSNILTLDDLPSETLVEAMARGIKINRAPPKPTKTMDKTLTVADLDLEDE